MGVLKLFEGTGDLECVVATIRTPEGSLQKVIDGTSFSIGRAPDCVLSVPHAGISRLHLLVTVKRGEVYIMDQESSNGTFLNANKIEAKKLTHVKPTDEIKLGLSDVVMQFQVLEKHFKTDYIAESLLPSQEKDNLMALIKASNHKAQEIISSAQAQADHITQMASEKARNLENQTLLKQEEIISSAQVEGQGYIAEAKRKAAQILVENEDKVKASCQSIYDQADRIRKEAESYFQNRVKDAEIRGTEIIDQHTKLAQELVEDLKEKTVKKTEAEIRDKLASVVKETTEKEKYLTELKSQCQEYELNRRKEIEIELAKRKSELEAQFERDKAEKFSFIQAKIEALEKEYMDKNDSFEKEYLSRTSHLETELQEKKSRIEQEIAEKTSKLDGDFTAKFTRLDSEYKEKFSKLESDYAGRSSQLESDFNNRMTKLDYDFTAKQTSLESSHAIKMSELDKQYMNLKLELEEKHRRDIDEAAASLVKQKQMLDTEVQSQRQELVQVSSELASTNQKYSEVKARFDDIQGTLQGLQKTEADLIKSLNDKREQVKKSDDELKAIKAEIDSQQEKFVGVKNTTEAQIEEYQTRLAKLKSAFEAESQRLKKESEKEVAVFQEQIDKAKEQIELQAKLDRAEAHKKTMDYIDAERSKIDDYRTKLLQEKKELDHAFDKTKREFESKTKEVIELEKQKVEEARQAFITNLNRERQVITDDVTIAIMKIKNNESLTPTAISDAVSRVFSSHVSSHSVDSTIKAASQDTSKLKIQYMGYGLGLALSGLLGFKFFIEPQINRHIAGTQEHAEATAPVERPKYVPPQSTEYKENYTDAVLYTQKFADIYLDEQLHDKWFKYVSGYMYENWRVDETKTIEALSVSKTLVQNLKTTGSNLDAEFYQKGIEKMREVEQESEKRMIEIFGTKVKYEAFRRKEREFFEPYVQNQ